MLASLPAPLLVFLYGSVTALATGLGAVPFAFVRNVSPRVSAAASAIAAGLMLGASLGLLAEGSQYGALQTVIGSSAGVLFILLMQRVLGGHSHDVQRMAVLLTAMTAHSFAEGMAVGVSFGGGATLAAVITIAIAVHNVPEGVAITAVLRPRGKSVLACAGWSIVSSAPQPLMAVPAFLAVEAFRPALPYGTGFAAGAMVFMVLVELLPEAYDHASRSRVASLVTVSFIAMVLFQQLL